MARTRRTSHRITMTKELARLCKRLDAENPDKTIRELSVEAGVSEKTFRNAIGGLYDEKFEHAPASSAMPDGAVPLPMIALDGEAVEGKVSGLAPYEMELRAIARVCAVAARALVLAWFSQDVLGETMLAEIDDAMAWMDGKGDAE